MPISFNCSACDANLRVKDELLGRKIKCPKCGEVTVVREPKEAEEAEEMRPPKKEKKKKSGLNADVNDWQQAFNNFDIRRFTAVGWLLFALAVGIGFGCFFLGQHLFPPERSGSTLIWVRYGPGMIGGSLGGLGSFFIGVGVLYLVGIRCIRPKTGFADASNSDGEKPRARGRRG